MVNAVIVYQCAAALAGLVLSVLIEQLLIPRPALRRPLAAWHCHIGLWMLCYVGLLAVLERPWFAMALQTAVWVLLVQVNNAKFKSLQEPFVFQDYEYFTDAIRHPRLYIPFLGWGKFFVIVLGMLLAFVAGLLSEQVPHGRVAWDDRVVCLLVMALLGLSLLWRATAARLPVQLQPALDMQRLGLLSCLWRYGGMSRQALRVANRPFSASQPIAAVQPLPHLVAVQSESFFDARRLSDLVRGDVLAAFDQMRQEAVAHGRLRVPAWGANTVRSEFAFLSGLDAALLGIHQFNPYQAIVRGEQVETIASHLQALGYKTVCIHPYLGDFYQRKQVLPKLGFDAFFDIDAFSQADYYGPYIGDMAVAQKIINTLQHAEQPLFIYAITMENHGPLHLETVQTSDVDAAYHQQPAAGFDDLTIYLRHLRNADSMVRYLTQTLKAMPTEVGLCWYGDHVPIMPEVYARVGIPDGRVEYVIWRNRPTAASDPVELPLSALAPTFLRQLRVLA